MCIGIISAAARRARGVPRLFGNGLDNLRVRMAQNQRSPRTNVIDVLVPIGVPQARAGCSINHDWFAAHGAKRAHRTVHAANEHVSRASEYLLGARPLHPNQLG